MKILLLFTAFMLTFSANAQNTDFVETLNNMNFEQIKSFSNEIAAVSRTKWIPLYDNDNDKTAIIWFVDSAVPSKHIEDIKAGRAICETGECLPIIYTVFYEGANANLEIKGTKKYRFKEVYVKYTDIFPIWQKYFQPSADINTLPDNYKLQSYKQGSQLFKFKEGTAPYWTLQKFY